MIQVKIFNSYNGTGIAILTGTYRVFVVNNVEDPRNRRLAEVPGEYHKGPEVLDTAITWISDPG